MSSIKKEANANQPPVSLKANNRAVRQLSDRHLNTSSRRTPVHAKSSYPAKASLWDRHCEPTGRANARPMTGSAKQSIARAVIASAAKQSISPRKDRMDCFAALAMTSKRTFATSRRDAPEALMNLSPKEGVGNAGCPLHPRPRVHLVVVERTRVTTSTPESPDVPARNGFNGRVGVWRGGR